MTKQKNSTGWYTLLLGLTIIIPVFYFIFLYLMIQNSGPTIEELFYAQPVFTVSLMISLINPVWGHVLNQIPKEERIKKGGAISYFLICWFLKF